MATGIRRKISATMMTKPMMPTVCGLIGTSRADVMLRTLSTSSQTAAGKASTMPAIIRLQCTTIGIERSGEVSSNRTASSAGWIIRQDSSDEKYERRQVGDRP